MCPRACPVACFSSVLILALASCRNPALAQSPLAGTRPAVAHYAANPAADRPGQLRFWGCEAAELYTREIAESYAGVLRHNYVSQPGEKYPPGFVHASPIPQPWSGTFWTRDGGTFLRELVLWGNLEHACLTTECLIQLVDRNEDGFYAFPEYFKESQRASGAELDGTTSIVIGMSLLWQRLPAGHPTREQIYAFLHQQDSPVGYVLHELAKSPLLAGTGEFGGGCGIPGFHCNVVQNYLAILALNAAANMESEQGDQARAGTYRQAAQTLRSNMMKHLVAPDGAWIWCVDPKTLKPDPAIINHEINKGFGGLNGPACMYADVLGLDPLASDLPEADACLKTLEALYQVPGRKQQFDKYGIWPQFDVFRGGLSSGPSYGDGYALQTMLLYDKMDMAERALQWMATSTYRPVPEYKLNRESPYYFYERSYSPDAVGKVALEEGCGALNLVNVTEQLKVARLILGVDDTSLEVVKIIPRLPKSWNGVEASNWPIRTKAGPIRANIKCEKNGEGTHFTLTVNSGKPIQRLEVRIPGNGSNPPAWHKQENVAHVELR